MLGPCSRGRSPWRVSAVSLLFFALWAACTDGPTITRTNPFDPGNQNTGGQPLDLRLVVDSAETTVRLEWDDLLPLLGSFESVVIYRAVLDGQADATGSDQLANEGDFVEVGRVNATETTWLDRNFIPFGARVEYRITVFHPSQTVGESAPSSIVFYGANMDLDADGVLDGDCADNYDVVAPGAPELCDTLDNDCDGTDDGFTESCYTGPDGTLGVGQCAAGTRLCTDGAFQNCMGETLPEPEACGDGVDNNCDGLADDVDADGDGFVSDACGGPDCNDAESTVYAGAVEICDNLDNDCNDVTDDIPGIDDGNPCTIDTCDFSTGNVRHDPAPNGTDCADADQCNGAETCQAGVCSPGAPPDCNDNNSCTADSCDSAVGCVNAPTGDGSGCDDEVSCTENDVCGGGVCAGTPNNGLCDNGLFCDGAETCDPLNDCQAGVPPFLMTGWAVPTTAAMRPATVW